MGGTAKRSKKLIGSGRLCRDAGYRLDSNGVAFIHRTFKATERPLRIFNLQWPPGFAIRGCYLACAQGGGIREGGSIENDFQFQKSARGTC